MSDKPWYLSDQPTPNLHQWIFAQMAKGAGYAALVFFGVVFFIFIWVAIGSILPPESKEAEDPTPNSAALEAPATPILRT